MQWWLRRVTDILNIEIVVHGELPHENDGSVLWFPTMFPGGYTADYGVTPISFLEG